MKKCVIILLFISSLLESQTYLNIRNNIGVFPAPPVICTPITAIDSITYQSYNSAWPPLVCMQVYKNGCLIYRYNLQGIDSVFFSNISTATSPTLNPNPVCGFSASCDSIFISVPSSSVSCYFSDYPTTAILQRGYCISTTNPNPNLSDIVIYSDCKLDSVFPYLSTALFPYPQHTSGIKVPKSLLGTITTTTNIFVRGFAITAFGTTYSGNTDVIPCSSLIYQPAWYKFNSDTVYNIGFGGNKAKVSSIVNYNCGSRKIIQKGFCYGNSISNMNNFVTINSSSVGSYTCTLTNLLPNQTYYFASFVVDSTATRHVSGNIKSFAFPGSPSTGHYLGESFGGGIIFYLDSTGLGGLIAAPNDLPGTYPWGSLGMNDSVPNAKGTSIGSGLINTLSILSHDPGANIAARACDNFTFGGFNDWFLPSYDELSLMKTNSTFIGGFNNSSSYWSSTQVGAVVAIWGYIYEAWKIDWFGGFWMRDFKSVSYSVRPIRKF